MTIRTITIQPAGVRLQCGEDTSLLDAALGAGFFPHHSCRRGECNTCEVRVVSGTVRYPEGFVPEGVRAGHCLACQARPADDVVIEAPEVAATPGRRIVQAGARVIDIRRVNGDVAIVRLQVPPASGFAFDPGQYVDVVLRDGSRRSYSMANAPDGEGFIEWHIRAMPQGRFSTHVYERLKARDLLRIEGPFGGFKLRHSSAPVILLASGTGYAPIVSMLRSHGDELADRGAVLYWGGRRRQDLYAMEEAIAWAASDPAFRFVPVLSLPDEGWTGRTGFVHEAVVQDHPGLSLHEVYACGNPLMVEAARHAFVRDHGLDAGSFFSDAFVTARPLAVESA